MDLLECDKMRYDDVYIYMRVCVYVYSFYNNNRYLCFWKLRPGREIGPRWGGIVFTPVAFCAKNNNNKTGKIYNVQAKFAFVLFKVRITYGGRIIILLLKTRPFCRPLGGHRRLLFAGVRARERRGLPPPVHYSDGVVKGTPKTRPAQLSARCIFKTRVSYVPTEYIYMDTRPGIYT